MRRKTSRHQTNVRVIPFWKYVRILILLIILLAVALNAWRDKNQDWTKPIIIVLHPVNADGREQTQRYIQQLKTEDFDDAQQYLRENIQHFRGQASSVYVKYAREMTEKPPAVPTSGSALDIILWSLKFRYYAWKHEQREDSSTVTLYLNYYDPSQKNSLKHSTALQNGRIGIVNLFADKPHHGSNQVVLVHELLHAFGATDKYDLSTGQPIYPIGFAEPNKNPRYPQQKAEIMGGYIPITPSQSQTPNSLKQTIVGDTTAMEVGWKP